MSYISEMRLSARSGKRGSNPRPSRWQRDALPLSYFRRRAGRPEGRTYSPARSLCRLARLTGELGRRQDVVRLRVASLATNVSARSCRVARSADLQLALRPELRALGLRVLPEALPELVLRPLSRLASSLLRATTLPRLETLSLTCHDDHRRRVRTRGRGRPGREPATSALQL